MPARADHPRPFFLGLDASTQALKASLLSATLDVHAEAAVNFDADLPALRTRGGVRRGPEGSGEVYAPVEVLGLAMDRLMDKIKGEGWDLGAIRGVSAAGQQHASVYWSHAASGILGSIDPALPLAPQLDGAYSRDTIPNWQDSSTSAECRALDAAFGGSAALARATGSKAHERFTGAQIMRFRRLDPAGYAGTSRISLVSSAITTLLCLDGEVKGIDESDACGMNLWAMDTPQRGWHRRALEVVVGDAEGGVEGLEDKLGRVETDAGRVVGRIGRWFVDRYGFHPECCVFPGTGDNPATFLSLTLRPSEGLVSLGTSDVVLVSTTAYNPHPEYHAFFHPAQIAPPSAQDKEECSGGQIAAHHYAPQRYFNMLVYKNGSLAREHVRDKYYSGSWDAFNAAVEKRRPRAAGDVPQDAAFWWLLPDIIPDNAEGVYRYHRDSSTVETRLVKEYKDVESNAMAILASQLLNYRARSSAILDSGAGSASASASGVPAANGHGHGLAHDANGANGVNGHGHANGNGDGAGADHDQPHALPHLRRVYATGGAARNSTIVSLMADVLGAPVSKNVEYDPDPDQRRWVDADWNACSVGVAYKARWGWERHLAAERVRATAAAADADEEQSQSQRQWVDFDTVVRECRAARAARRAGAGDDDARQKGMELEEEGIRNVAVPGPGAAAWEGAVGWWAELEARALKGE